MPRPRRVDVPEEFTEEFEAYCEVMENEVTPEQQWHGFSDAYHNEVFLVWYRYGQPKITELAKYVPYTNNKTKMRPSIATLRKWKREEKWNERAQKMDVEVIASRNRSTIQYRIDMLKRHEQLGNTLQEIGANFLEENGISSARDAINLVKLGVDLERQSAGLSNALAEVAKMDDNKLLESIKKMLERTEDSGENIIEAVLTDVQGEKEQDGS